MFKIPINESNEYIDINKHQSKSSFNYSDARNLMAINIDNEPQQSDNAKPTYQPMKAVPDQQAQPIKNFKKKKSSPFACGGTKPSKKKYVANNTNNNNGQSQQQQKKGKCSIF